MSAEVPPSSAYSEAKQYAVFPRSAAATGLIDDVRHAEVLDIQKDLERLDEMPRAHRWETTSETCFAVGLGGVIALIPLLAQPQPPWVVGVYLAVEVLLFLGAAICRLACRDMQAERTGSLSDIKRKVKALVDSVEVDAARADPD